MKKTKTVKQTVHQDRTTGRFVSSDYASDRKNRRNVESREIVRPRLTTGRDESGRFASL